MALLVQKFGGTSLATLEHINRAADIIAKARQAGHDVVVIVSAMSGETDRLIALANKVCDWPDEREYAALVSTGEQVAMALLALALIKRKVKARSYTGAQAKIQTCNNYKKARIQSIDTQHIKQDLNQGNVVIIAGFQGVDNDGSITTLGRGGSDTTAVAIAASLKADECQIYTDVDGIYTTDPKVVADARRLDRISFEEMLEFASLGAKVLQIRAVEFAGKYKVPVRVLSSAKDGPGTLITYENVMENPIVSGLAFSKSEAKVSILGVPNEPGVASTILTEISTQGVNYDMIVQNTSYDEKTDFTFTVHSEEYQQTMKHMRKIAKQLSAEGVVGDTSIAKISIVGAGLRSHSTIAPMMFQTLAHEGINIQLISTSEIKISVVIDEESVERGVQSLHNVFKLSEKAKDESHTLKQRKLFLAAGK
jgi:aspartate kinase